MNEKYQKYHREILSGTLNDMLMKSVSYQANIKLANDIIAEQEKQIEEWKSESDSGKKELENRIESLKKENEILKNSKSNSENARISILEDNNRKNSETINKLNSEIDVLNKVKKEYDLLKGQISNLETFRNELIKEREAHNQTKTDLENIISDLKQQIDILQAPPKRKKAVKELTNTLDLAEIVQQTVSSDLVKDGGSF